MPEMSFGRTIRFRRTKLGLSQARLGELVGRSPAAVRTWEKDSVTPTDPGVLQALAAVLGVDQKVLFDKAGLQLPTIEDSPTMEQILGSLAPEGEDYEPYERSTEIVIEEFSEHEDEAAEPDDDDSIEEFDLGDFEPAMASGSGAIVQAEAVGLVTTTPSITYTIPAPPVPEPTYVEDESQRQMYRIRHMATAVAVVALFVMFVWAMGRGWSEFGAWWDDFIGRLQL